MEPQHGRLRKRCYSLDAADHVGRKRCVEQSMKSSSELVLRTNQKLEKQEFAAVQDIEIE